MKYKSKDINKLFIDFYRCVNNIIYNIHCNEYISRYLFICKYNELNSNKLFDYPFTICLGCARYIQYQDIFRINHINLETEIISKDYDISMALLGDYNNDDIVYNIEKIINNTLNNYKFLNIDKHNFSVNYKIQHNRIHFRVECDTKLNSSFHIFELSLWLNGQISDNFTINDFINRNTLYLYKKENIYYYLLPLELLVKTTLYAIVDFFEKRNFNKCVKYLDRVIYIKSVYQKYQEFKNPSNILNEILASYKNKIKRKYKMINDYPFSLSYNLKYIENNGIIKCIYRELRTNNRKILKETIRTFTDKCKNKEPYQSIDSNNTNINTDELL